LAGSAFDAVAHLVNEGAEEGFLLVAHRFAPSGEFAGRTAGGTEFELHAAHAAEFADALVAKNPPTMGTLPNGVAGGVAEAGRMAVGERGGNGRGRLFGSGHLGNGDIDWRGVQDHFQGANAKHLARVEGGFADGITVHKRAIGGVEIPNENEAVFQKHLAVEVGNLRVIEDMVVLRASAETVDPRLEFDDRSRFRHAGPEDQLRHK